MTKVRGYLCFLMMLFSLAVSAQGVPGKWQTIDDKTGKPKAIVQIYKKGGQLFGKIVKILEQGRENAVCRQCEGRRKDKPILGMHIFEGLKRNDDGEWKGKNLLDPENGTTYRCKIWLNPNNTDELRVRGYLAFLYRTQTWIRAED